MDRLAFRSPADAAGFTQLSNLVLLDKALSDGAKVTYMLLLSHAWQAGKCFPGQDTLAQERGCSDRSVRSHLAELTARGLITIERRGQARTNLYWLESLAEVYKSPEAPENDRKNSSTQADDRKFSSDPNRKKTSTPKRLVFEEETEEKELKTLNVGKRSSDYAALPEVADLARRIGDTKSLRRYGQLYDIALRSGHIHLWDEALRALERRIAAPDQEALRSKGAYFCKTLADLLLSRGVAVPVGSKSEREDVRGQLRASLGLEDGPN